MRGAAIQDQLARAWPAESRTDSPILTPISPLENLVTAHGETGIPSLRVVDVGQAPGLRASSPLRYGQRELRMAISWGDESRSGLRRLHTSQQLDGVARALDGILS